jgi:lactate dehydrogenase-like 2-hydroxyacid dehydrogenase
MLTRRWPDAVENALRCHYEVTTNPDDAPMSAEQLKSAMRQYDALCPTVSDRITADVLSVPDTRVRIIGNYGTGLDHIDLQAARDAGIVVTNTPDVLTESTAELTLLLILMASRRASEGERELRSGHWTGWRPNHMLGWGLAGKTLGLVGFGRIARAVAQRARAALGMKIAYYNRHRATLEQEEALAATYYSSLDDLTGIADVLSLHCPGGAATHHLIDQRRLAQMRRSAMLINTARGTMINESDLAAALTGGQLAAAALDVYEYEPAINPALLAAPHAVLLPHLGSATAETRTAMGMRVAANLHCFFSGEPLVDRVE